MAFWIPLAIGAGMGLAKYGTDKEKEARDRKLQAETARYSAWTGMAPDKVNEPSLLGNVVQGGTAGAMFGQQFGGAESAVAPMQTTPMAQGGWLEMQKYQQQNPYNYGQAAPTLYS